MHWRRYLSRITWARDQSKESISSWSSLLNFFLDFCTFLIGLCFVVRDYSSRVLNFFVNVNYLSSLIVGLGMEVYFFLSRDWRSSVFVFLNKVCLRIFFFTNMLL